MSATASVALVVPIYNMAEHLAECLASIEAQTVFDEMQVVLVDDGSTDAGPEIAAAFAGRHANVVLLREPNRGPGAARNRGLREVTAPFVGFCDSDDRLPADAVETLRGIALEHDADVAVGALETFPRRRSWPWFGHLDADSRVIPGIENAPGLVHAAGPCDKLFRTEFIRRMQLSFAEGTHFEDAYVSVPALLTADRIAVTRKVVYHYRLRSGSIMRSLWDRPANFWDHLALQEFLATVRPRLSEPRRSVLDLFAVRSFQGFAMRAPFTLTGEDLRSFYDRCVGVFGEVAPDVVTQACVSTRHRLAFVALLHRDWDLFADRRTSITGLEVVDGALHLRLTNTAPEHLRPLLRVDRTHVLLESLDRLDGGSALRLRGRVAVDGLTTAGPLTWEMGVAVRGCGPARPARLAPRTWPSQAGNPVTDDWTGFCADLPSGALAGGFHPVRLEVRTGGGAVDLAVAPSTGLQRAAHPLSAGRHRVRVLRAGRDVALKVTSATAPGRLREAAGLLRADLRHAYRRQPLWRARLLRLVTARSTRSGAWLLGEHARGGPDNATALFRHLREHRPEIPAYWVADGEAETAGLHRLGNVVLRGSRRHRLLMLRAAVLVSAHDIDDCLLPAQWPKGLYLQHLAWRIGSRRVFLQHGIGYDPADHAWHRGTAGAELFLTSSSQEAAAVCADLGYTESQVVVTGLPRFDELDRGPAGRRLLVVPGTGAGEQPAPVREFWRAALDDEVLRTTLERTGTALDVLAVDDPGTGAVQAREAVLDCSVFVTDRSALALDAARAGRTVLLAAPDGVPAHLDHLRDEGACVVSTAAELVDALVRRLEGPDPSLAASHDRGASARTVAAIEAVLRR